MKTSERVDEHVSDGSAGGPIGGVPGGLADGLSAVDHATMQTEVQRWKYAGAKEQHVRAEFGESLTRYYQRLNALIDTVAAEAVYPALVRRLRRLREERQQAREVGSGTAQTSRS